MLFFPETMSLSPCFSGGKSTEFKIASGRQAYLVLIEGEAEIAGHTLQTRDALEIVEEDILIIPKEEAHVLLLEMKKA